MANNREIRFDMELLTKMKIRLNCDAKAMLNADLCRARDDWGTLLHYATFFGNEVIMSYLIELGSDVDAIASDSTTPLMIAVANDCGECEEAVKVLLNAGADINMVNVNGASAFHMVLDPLYFEPEILQAFLDRVHSDAVSGQDMVDRLIESGCSLYRVAFLKDVKVMGFLLSCGWDVNSVDHRGKTALHAAVELNYFPLASLLLQHGAHVDALDQMGTAPLYTAAWQGSNHLVQLLLENGANPNTEDLDTGNTPFFAIYSVSGGNREDKYVECAELLLQYGAIPRNSRHPFTLLDQALFRQSSAKVKLLIAHVAMLEMKGTRLDASVMRCNVREYAAQYLHYEKFYGMCQQILRTKVLGTWTVFGLITESQSKMRKLARNRRLVPKLFNIFMSGEYPYYFGIVWSRVYTAINTVKLEDDAIAVICQIFNVDQKAGYIFTREIVSYLNEDDLKQLGRV